MTQTAATYATAPRDKDALVKLGRFQLRTLAQEIPAWSGDDERQAFLKLGTDEQAAAVYKALLERDKKEKGGGAKAATTTATPKRTPSNKGTSASAETPAAASGGDTGGDTGGNAAAVLALLAEIKSSQENLETKVDELAASNEALRLQLAGNNKLGQVGISLALQMSEQVLNAAASDVLQGAIDQLGDIAGQLAEVVGDSGAGEEEGNEGNE